MECVCVFGSRSASPWLKEMRTADVKELYFRQALLEGLIYQRPLCGLLAQGWSAEAAQGGGGAGRCLPRNL